MAAQLRALVDKLQTDVSNGLFQELTKFGAERFLTPLGVKQQSGIIGAYGTNHLRLHANSMGGGGQAPRVSLLKPDLTNKYYIDDHGLEELVTPNDYANYELPFDAEQDKTQALTYANLVAKEYGLAYAMSPTAALLTNYTTLTGGSQFSDYANSDPVSVIRTARETVRDNCGFYPNRGLIEAAVYEVLRVHPQIWDRLGFKYNQAGQLTQDNVAAALNVDRLQIVESVYDSSSEGQTPSITPIWGKHLFFAVLQDNPALRQKTFGYHVFYKNRGVRVVYKYAVNNPPESTAILCQDSYDMFLSDFNCGYGVYNAIA